MSATAIEIERALRAHPVGFGFPRATEWPPIDEISGHGIDVVAIIGAAEKLLDAKIRSVRLSEYLAYSEVGSRVEADRAIRGQFAAVFALGLAEAVERQGRFLPALQDHMFAACELTSWIGVAHMSSLTPRPEWLAAANYGKTPGPDLFATTSAANLAIIDYLLGEALNPVLRDRIRFEIDRRVFAPFEAVSEWWCHGGNNWNGVCNGAVAIAALLLIVDARRQALILAQAMGSIETYLDLAFEADGTSNEGIGYWQYGLTWTCLAAELLRSRSGGKLDLTGHPKMSDIAAFPTLVEIDTGVFPPFSDSHPHTLLQSWLLELIAARCDQPGLAEMARRHSDGAKQHSEGLSGALTRLFFLPTHGRNVAPAKRQAFPRSVYLASAQWLIARPAQGDHSGLALAAKGGHNAENHNHNDVGSIALFNGGKMLIADPGAAKYDAGYFGPRRYDDYPLACSRGHSVPSVNGCFQRAGRDAAAEVLRQESTDAQDLLEIEYSAAYPDEAGILELKREIVYLRAPGPHAEITDTVAFRSPKQEWESRLVSFSPFTIFGKAAGVEIDGAELRIIAEGEDLALETDTILGCRPGGKDGKPGDLHVLRVRQKCAGNAGQIKLSLNPTE